MRNDRVPADGQSSSRDPFQTEAEGDDKEEVPFRKRIRPGMVVRWEPPAKFPMRLPGKQNMVVVLCPVSAVGARVRDVLGKEVVREAGEAGEGRYLCAMVLPSVAPESYELALWRQVVVDVEAMEAEVLLEYDVATRYYFMAV